MYYYIYDIYRYDTYIYMFNHLTIHVYIYIYIYIYINNYLCNMEIFIILGSPDMPYMSEHFWNNFTKEVSEHFSNNLPTHFPNSLPNIEQGERCAGSDSAALAAHSVAPTHETIYDVNDIIRQKQDAI